MDKSIINTFTGGMNKDADKSTVPSNKYLDAQNFRLITTKGNTSGSLETIKGNHLIEDTDIVDGEIIGSCQLRDWIVLFTYDGDYSRIYKVRVDLTYEEQNNLTLLYDDRLSHDDSFLNFNTGYPIRAIGKYETPNIQKVYWTDGNNNLRYINIADNLTLDGTDHVPGDKDFMSADKFEFLPKFIGKKPTLIGICGGKINTGVIAYAYQLYTINGAETAFSPLSDPIHVVSDSDFLVNTLSYKGDELTNNSGKGFTLTIDNTANVGYNRLRLIRVQYSTINSVPEIFIANEISIDPAGTVVGITDVGSVLSQISVDEFNITSTELFKCQDIATKDNRLFVANIGKSDFKVDETWDARAVRFNDEHQAVVHDGTSGPSNVSTFNNWGVSYPLTHDGINYFNNPDNDGNELEEYKFCADGETVGAEGPRIKIDFESEQMVLDSSNLNNTFYVTPPTDDNDLSYLNYASPWKGGKLSWQRDEVYRLFVVFGNDRGQVSDPKWIIDLRMPSLHDASIPNNSNSTAEPYLLAQEEEGTGKILTHRLYPRILFKSFPTNATWAQIHRVKRERTDRFVVTQALVVPSYDINDGAYHPGESMTPLLESGRVIKLVSPEINVNKNIAKQGQDYLDYVTYYGGNYHTSELKKGNNGVDYRMMGKVFKLKGAVRIPWVANDITQITDAVPVFPANIAADAFSIDGITYNNYAQATGISSHGCSGLVVTYNNPSWEGEGKVFPIVNYKSNVFDSQYGGNTYEGRMANSSIPCSDVITTTNIWYDISYGDTYINYFDVSTLLADLTKDNYYDTWSETVYVPLESSINCDLMSSKESAHFYTATINSYDDYKPFLRQEAAGTYTMTIHESRTFLQSTPLYLYNSVYSQQIDVKPAISLIVDKTLETEFDSMIKVSNFKFNGEITDSWTKFGINNFLEVDSIHGPINALKTFNDKMFVFQDKAFAMLAINERSLITDSNSSQIVLGTGGILDRADYVSTVTGCKDKFSIAGGMTGLFWFDRVNNFLIKYSGAIDKISLSKEVQSYFDQNVIPDHTVIAHPDINNNEILFTFSYDNGILPESFTISFNEFVDTFVSFYGFIPAIYIPYDSRYFTTNYADRDLIWLHDSNIEDCCKFYGGYVDSTLELIFNPDYMNTKVFDNLFFISNTSSKIAILVDNNNPVKERNINIFDDTFDTLQCYNDYQNTGVVPLQYASGVGKNLERRERTWTTFVPRNIVSSAVKNDPDPFATTSTIQLFKERMRDKYLIAYFTYDNSKAYDRFMVSNMACKYRISYR